ncbi:MAG: inorganic phosphate transporter [Parachlamydiales bacterium]|jgi:phosphate/sulfate permease
METKILEFLAIIIGLYMAWNIGSNDVANAISTSIGSKIITLKKAIIVAAIFEFSGAYFLGGNVAETIQSRIVNPNIFDKDIYIFIYGMLAALLSTGLLLNVASFMGLPISTTHAIVGSVLGFGAIIGGIHAVNWKIASLIFFSWVITPAFSGSLAFLIFTFIQRKILFAFSPLESAKKFVPFFAFITLTLFPFSILSGKITNIDKSLSISNALLLSLTIGFIAFCVAFFLVRRIKITSCKIIHRPPGQLISLEKAKKHLERTYLSSRGDTKEKTSKLLGEVEDLIDEYMEETKFTEKTTEYTQLEKSFGYLQIMTLCLVAFAHGTNDVANAIGPVAAIIQSLSLQKVGFATSIPPWILFIGSIGIVVGLSTWGWRIVETIAHKITALTPTRGFSAEFSAAITILIASQMGMPISTTHALVGAVFGIGLAKGLSALNLKIMRNIFLSWIVTLPLCAVMTIIMFFLIKFIFKVII